MIDLNGARIVMDNVEAMRILTDVGIVDKLQPVPPWTRAHTYFEYGEFWCVGTYDKGHELEVDNGFGIVMLPKSSFTSQEAYELLELMMEETKTHQGGTSQIFPLDKTRN